jgi:mannosyltransferase OCH1-like enzyme
MPDHIALCVESVYKNCGMQVQFLSPQNLTEFLPNIRSDVWDIRQIAHRADYIRACLLEKYGGIWVDCDFICLRPLRPLLDHITEHGLSCSGQGPDKISIWFLASAPGGAQVARWVSAMNQLFDEKGANATLGWNDIGSLMLIPIVEEIGSNYVDRNLFGWIPYNRSDELFQNENLATADFNGYGFMLFNKTIGEELSKYSRDEILHSNTMLGQLYRRALKE